MSDWLDQNEHVGVRVEQHRKAVEHAKLYVEVFVRNEAGRKLLEQWTTGFAKKRTPVNAPHTEYAANEAVRAFIEGIHDQIRFASKDAS